MRLRPRAQCVPPTTGARRVRARPEFRARRARYAAQERGWRFHPTCPHGWTLADDGVTLLVNAGEQNIVQSARELRSAGLSPWKIAARLAAEGLLPCRVDAGTLKR